MRLFSYTSIEMLDYTLTTSKPVASQSGALFAPVEQVNLGCETGNSHTLKTVVQTGTGKKPKNSKTKRVRKYKKTSKTRKTSKTNKNGKSGKSGKNAKRKYKRTMNRRRKRSRMSRTGKKSHKRTRMNQIGRGSSYENVLTPVPMMGPQGAARAHVEIAHTGPVSNN